MIEISRNGIIEMYRGDTFEFPLFINIGTKGHPVQYIVQEGDIVYFSVGEANQPFEKALIRKIFTVEDLDEDGNITVRMSSSDTENVLPGTYYMQIKIKLANGNIATITPMRKFFIFD